MAVKYQFLITDEETGTHQTIPVSEISVIPPGGTVMFVLPDEITDAEFQHVVDMLGKFFGQRHHVCAIRCGDAEIVYFDDDIGSMRHGKFIFSQNPQMAA